MPAYPNPFNPRTTICYKLPVDCRMDLGIFNVNGRRVKTLQTGIQKAGIHELIWDASDLASGIYILRAVAGEFSASRKVVLMK